MTPSPTVPFTPTTDPKSTDGILGRSMILQHIFGMEIYLQDVATGEIRMLDPNLGIVMEDGFLGWTRNGCGFYVRMSNQDIVEVDLNGKIMRTVFSHDIIQYQGEGTASSWVEFSPAEEWVSFEVGEGDRVNFGRYGGHHEIENVYVISMDGLIGPYQLSERGGSWNYAWSRDNQYLAYTDYDAEGRFQVYVSTFDRSQRKQITDFDVEGVPNRFIWSPDSQYFTIFYEYPEGSYEFIIANILENQISSLGKVDQLWVNLWWEDEGLLVTVIDGTISWYDPESGEVLKKNDNVPFIQGHIMPSGTKFHISCLGYCLDLENYGYYMFDVRTNSLDQMPNFTRIIDLADWAAAPLEFTGEGMCID
jgi:hypothetical protein